MHAHQERSPQGWFELAQRSYVDNQHTCAWCGGTQVFQVKRGPLTSYTCGSCDFHAVYHEGENRFLAVPGAEQPEPRSAPLIGRVEMA